MTTFYGRFPLTRRAPSQGEGSNHQVKARFAELNAALRHGPPLTPAELREFEQAKRLVRLQDEERRAGQAKGSLI